MKQFKIQWIGSKDSKLESGIRAVDAHSSMSAYFKVKSWMEKHGIKPIRLSIAKEPETVLSLETSQ